MKNEPLPTIDIAEVVDDRAEILSTLTAAEGRLQEARANLARLYAGTHVDARHLVNALAATKLAQAHLDTAIHQEAVKARELAVPWSVIGRALGTSKQNAFQRHGVARA